MNFAIVRFVQEEDAPGIISSQWIIKGDKFCYYPNVKTDRQKDKFLLLHKTPEKDWLKCPIRILKRFDSYQSARRHLQDAEETSNLDSDENLEYLRPRGRKISCRSDSSTDDEISNKYIKKCDSYPQPPPTSPNLPPISPNLPPTSSLTFSSPPNSASLIDLANKTDPPPILPADSHSLSTNIKNLNCTMEKILTEQKQIVQTLSTFILNQTRIEGKLNDLITSKQGETNSGEKEDDINFMTLLPLGINDFQNLNKRIVESINFKKILTNFCMTIGGRDPRSMICNVMRKLMSDDTGECYSLTGRSTKLGVAKLPFEETEVYKIILEICFRSFKETKLGVIREAISDWLMQSKFRKSKREKRSALEVVSSDYSTRISEHLNI